MPHRLDAATPGFAAEFRAFLAAERGVEEDVSRIVAAIIDDVRARGDLALFELTERLDRVRLDAATLRLSEDEIDATASQCSRETLRALAYAARRIEDYHRRQLPADLDYTDEAGVRLGHRWTAVESVGLYVPGGTAAYPSSVLMNALPAKVAGVERRAMVVPTPDGVINPLVLAAARLTGVTEIYRVGGAQAVAALAYGTETIAPVDKIVGPGNAYVAEAKRRVFGKVGIDTIAGPSEILVVADAKNDPRWIAADLLSQAEHDPVAQAILITDTPEFADDVEEAIDTHLETLDRRDIAAESWEEHGAIISVPDMDEAPALVNRIAPEHLELAIADPDAMLREIRHAGAIFVGRYAPEAVGDYVAGPNHVLPTSRRARFASGLSVLDFMKRSSLIGCDARALSEIGPPTRRLAEAEGLDAHALSVRLRLDEQDPA